MTLGPLSADMKEKWALLGVKEYPSVHCSIRTLVKIGPHGDTSLAAALAAPRRTEAGTLQLLRSAKAKEAAAAELEQRAAALLSQLANVPHAQAAPCRREAAEAQGTAKALRKEASDLLFSQSLTGIEVRNRAPAWLQYCLPPAPALCAHCCSAAVPACRRSRWHLVRAPTPSCQPSRRLPYSCPQSFFFGWPFVDGVERFVVEPQHQEHNGTFGDHIVPAVKKLTLSLPDGAAAWAELNRRLVSYRRQPNTRIPGHGLDTRGLTSEERRGMIVWLPLAAAGLLPAPVVRTLFQFAVLAVTRDMHCQTEGTLLLVQEMAER